MQQLWLYSDDFAIGWKKKPKNFNHKEGAYKIQWHVTDM